MASTIVSSIADAHASGWSSGGKSKAFYGVNSGRWWYFAWSSATVIASYSSSDGVTWTAGATLTGVGAGTFDGRELNVVYANIASTDVFHLNWGSLGGPDHVRATASGSTLTYGTINTAGGNGGGGAPFNYGTAVLSDGSVFQAGGDGGDFYAYKNATKDTSTSWTAGTWGSQGQVIGANVVQNAHTRAFVPYGAGGLCLGFNSTEDSDNPGNKIYFSRWSGTSWSGEVDTGFASVSTDDNDFSVCRLSDTDFHAVRRTSTGFSHRRYNGTSWSAGDAIPSGVTSVAGSGLGLASDGTTVWLVVLDSGAGDAVKYVTWTAAGGWAASWTALESSAATRGYLGISAQQDASGSKNWLVYWTEGSASPYAIKGSLLATSAGGGGATNWSQSLSDSFSALDAPSWAAVKTLLDALAGQESLQKTAQKPLAETLSTLDSLSKASFKTFLDWLSEKDAAQATKLAMVALSDRQSALDGLAKAVTRGLLDGFSDIDQFVRVWTAHLTLLEGLSQLDALAKLPAHVFLDWLSATDHATAQKVASGAAWTRTLAESHSALDLLLKTPGKWTQDQLAALDLFGRVWTAHLTLSEWVSAADTWAKGVVQSRQDISVVSDQLAKGLGKPLGERQTGQDALVKGITTQHAEALSQTDQLTRSAAYFRQVFDALSATEKVAAGRLVLVRLLDAAGLTDQVSTLLQHPLGQFALAQVISLVAAQLGMTVSLLVGTALQMLLSNFDPSGLAEALSNF